MHYHKVSSKDLKIIILWKQMEESENPEECKKRELQIITCENLKYITQ